ncbi:adenosylcobinamide-GDP ribazoletransferase [Gilvimarinus sp. SDUM040013]|uniref:Adenosylcobinamide-GDP ribazoletransferase n=1 Tax=Gilvimarinus gilvus TaxID=3058038 RepID=A0ABU4RYV4_9GAMM|nr:adenosylcobinamide-GDP ribazoletransferase [Gilvimarinus sp. SDUM040013]MDO3384569.1 adenosylcobinamide-GDP ribazoletransferase [Gilvimarinus sp. SDUM040013]MDX6850095.1 adenosylcobinamide-GDP ribazoletransferase [Gilvimarinus sp. SDUM040013]
MSINHKLTHYLQAFLYALVFLTRLPVGKWLHKPDSRTISTAVYFYPLVGLVLGLVLVLFASLVAGFGTWLAAALTVSFWVMLTGALHLDGLADCMDAYYAGHKITDQKQRRERILQVMHDPACGAVALVALVLVIMLKVIALASLWQQGAALSLLLVAPVLARTAILPFMALADYARQTDGGVSTPVNNSQSLWITAFLYCALVAVGLSFVHSAVLIVALAVLLTYWSRFWFKQIGGYTGDCLGALVELSEVLVLILLVALC